MSKMLEDIERDVRVSKKELAEIRKESSQPRLRPCRGDAELRQRDKAIEELDKRTDSLNEKIRELEKKRREVLAAVWRERE